MRCCHGNRWRVYQRVEWQTYKWRRFHRSHRGSRARRRRARPQGRRLSARDSETPLCHTRWRLRWREERVKKKRGKCSVRWWLVNRQITWLAGCTHGDGRRCCEWTSWLTNETFLHWVSRSGIMMVTLLLPKTGCPLRCMVNICVAIIVSAFCRLGSVRFNGGTGGTWQKPSHLKSRPV